MIIVHVTQSAQQSGKTGEELDKTEADIRTQVALQTSSVYSSGNLWDDGIILPQDTRKVGNHENT